MFIMCNDCHKQKQPERKISIAIERMPSPEEEPSQQEEPSSQNQQIEQPEQVEQKEQQSRSPPSPGQSKQQPRRFLGARDSDNLPLVKKSVRSSDACRICLLGPKILLKRTIFLQLIRKKH